MTLDLGAATVLVTGANRGFGRHLAEQLLARGATVYAGARDPRSVDLPGARPLALDVTDPASVTAAAREAGDVTVLINNAGVATGAAWLDDDLADVHREFDTNVFGTLAVTRAFVPVIEVNGGGALLNVLSVVSWFAPPHLAAYSASKSAEWSMTNGLRLALAPRGIQVSGLHVGYMDTDLAAGIDDAKSDPAAIAKTTLDRFAAGDTEILADDVSRRVQAGLAGGVAALYPDVA
ncbi:SDR family oxidoreductase [Actinomycetospora sp. TBRC 11914]|uniref:SDR family oxidoreductase n=1 Tax=Actinomycetospora sp. TBRC 11914 TaxID=2729387 RepID=UPI00145F5736|nr:SDR family oxidoreductase [Actinomycetospora sp. TBRC 11914]NMO88438.1 SDR family oxidoreductase [Actinomycetospora sp. TBRC 11914]